LARGTTPKKATPSQLARGTSPKKVMPGQLRLHRAGEHLRCLVIAPGPEEWAAVDVDSGAIVRAYPGAVGASGGGETPVAVLDLVEIELADDPGPPDPGRPEAVVLASAPQRLGRLRARHARRLVASLVARGNVRPLLGTVGPAISYSELDGTAPSIVIVEPTRGPEIVAVEGKVWSTFGMPGADERLPVVEARTAAVASLVPGTVLTRQGAASMLGYDPRYLVVALVPPVGGHARKAVIGVLPRP
jgi:hypothetical protein